MTAAERLRALADWCERHGVTEDKDFVSLIVGAYTATLAHVDCATGARILSGRTGVKVDDTGFVTELVDGQRMIFRVGPKSFPKTVDFPALEPTS